MIGFVVVAATLAVGVYWVLSNVIIKSKSNEDNPDGKA